MEEFQSASVVDEALRASHTSAPANAVEGYKASMNGDDLRILEQVLPASSLAPENTVRTAIPTNN